MDETDPDAKHVTRLIQLFSVLVQRLGGTVTVSGAECDAVPPVLMERVGPGRMTFTCRYDA